jgi:hypothetical protein
MRSMTRLSLLVLMPVCDKRASLKANSRAEGRKTF